MPFRRGATALVLIYLVLVPVWMIPPWWTPFVYLGLWLLIIVSRRNEFIHSGKPIRPISVGAWIVTTLMILLGGYAMIGITNALQGRTIPSNVVAVDLSFPMGDGIYLIANGGSHAIINAHFLTLDPQTDRQANYRGQSYAVDFVKVDDFGLRAAGWRPRNPDAYAIYDQPVMAPCDGDVREARDGRADMAVPEMDRDRIEGNYVLLQCGEIDVLMGHLRKGSVLVKDGDYVRRGDPVARAGNSGQTGEPHLHIHAQIRSTTGPSFSGEPLFLTFDGHFPVRNERIRVGRR